MADYALLTTNSNVWFGMQIFDDHSVHSNAVTINKHNLEGICSDSNCNLRFRDPQLHL